MKTGLSLYIEQRKWFEILKQAHAFNTEVLPYLVPKNQLETSKNFINYYSSSDDYVITKIAKFCTTKIETIQYLHDLGLNRISNFIVMCVCSATSDWFHPFLSQGCFCLACIMHA